MLCSVNIVYAQKDTTFYERVGLLQDLFNNTVYDPVEFQDTSTNIIHSISTLKRTKTIASRAEYLEKRLEYTQKDYGLSITGGYLENFNPEIGTIDDNLVFNRRFNAGVEWQILDNGFFENKAQARILEDQIIRDQLKGQLTEESFHYLLRFDQTIYTFNKVKIELLEARKASLQEQYTVIEELVLLKKLPKEDLIKIDSRLAEVQSMLGIYQSYNEYLGIEDDSLEFDPKNLPLIDLQYDKIFGMIGAQTDSILATRDYQDYYSWYHQIGLKAYAKYNYYDLVNNNNRSFISAGVNFSIPIPFNTKLKNEIESTKYLYDNERMIQERSSLHEDILNTGYEFRYKLKQFVSFYQKRKVFRERMRIEQVKVRMGDNNIDPKLGLELYDDLLSIDIELVDLLQNLYLKALKVHSKIPNVDIREIITVQPAEEINEYIDNKERSVYVWSKTFDDYSPEFLAEYVIYNEFEKVIIAVQKIDTIPEKKTFMQYASANAEIHFMLGNNKLFFEKDMHGYMQGILDAYPEIEPTGFHIDVEPHTFDDYKSRKQEYLNEYIEYIGNISTFCEEKGLELSISIPTHYGIEVIEALFPKVNAIYFMCYENVDTEFLTRKITPFIDNSTPKIVLAFRTEDFDNRIGMENKMKAMYDKTSLRKFAYHDLRRLIEFDRISVE